MSTSYYFIKLTQEIVERVESDGDKVPKKAVNNPGRVPELSDFLKVISTLPDLRIEQVETNVDGYRYCEVKGKADGEIGRWADITEKIGHRDERISAVSIERIGQDELYNELVQGVVDICGPLLVFNTSGYFDVRVPSDWIR